MDRRKHAQRTWKAWTLFLLALVAVGAPVWANAYVCPMERAAIAQRAAVQEPAGCCAKTQAAALPDASAARVEGPCDCAQLHWDVADVDVPRTVVLASGASSFAVVANALLFGRLDPIVRLRVVAHPPVAISSPPLWVRNQSIRC